MVTTNTAYAVSMEEGIITAYGDSVKRPHHAPLNENSIMTENSACALNRDEGYLVRCSKQTSMSSIERILQLKSTCGVRGGHESVYVHESTTAL